MVRNAFDRKPCPCFSPVDQIDGGLLEDAGANARQHVILCLPLEDDILDPGKIQQTAKKQPCRARPYNHNLFTHPLPPGQPYHSSAGK